MINRRRAKTYYFSVEGETERWYFEHLQKLINNSEKTAYLVKFIIRVKKDPREMVKSLPFTNKITINHICNIESNNNEHQKTFRKTLDNMEEACLMGKKLNYALGYSNFAFDLWIALHKENCNVQLTDRKQYLKYLNTGFKEHFISMDEYKQEDNFHRCLSKITLNDVLTAIKQAEKITINNQSNGYRLVKYKKFTYYTENPSLSVHNIILTILKDCKLLPDYQKA